MPRTKTANQAFYNNKEKGGDNNEPARQSNSKTRASVPLSINYLSVSRVLSVQQAQSSSVQHIHHSGSIFTRSVVSKIKLGNYVKMDILECNARPVLYIIIRGKVFSY